MRIEIQWDNDDKTIVRVDFYPGWTWADYRNIVHEAEKMMATVDYPTPVINFYHPGVQIPEGSQIANMRYMGGRLPDNIFLLVTQDSRNNIKLKVFLEVLGYKYEKNFWFVDSLGKAYKIIHDQYPDGIKAQRKPTK